MYTKKRTRVNQFYFAPCFSLAININLNIKALAINFTSFIILEILKAKAEMILFFKSPG